VKSKRIIKAVKSGRLDLTDLMMNFEKEHWERARAGLAEREARDVREGVARLMEIRGIGMTTALEIMSKAGIFLEVMNES